MLVRSARAAFGAVVLLHATAPSGPPRGGPVPGCALVVTPKHGESLRHPLCY